ncbi:MAG: hypothetical protein Kow00124_17190 [Anaerolineae bacterium]
MQSMTLLRDALRFTIGRLEHPMLKRELSGWSYLGLGHTLRRGCLPLILLVMTGSVACCGLSSVGALQSATSPEDSLLAGFFILFGILIGGEIIRFAAGLLATALSATTISAEVEGERLSLLRVTPLPTREIVLAKFGAVIRQLRLPMAAVTVARGVFLVGCAILIPLLISTTDPGTPLIPIATSPMPAGEALTYALDAIFGLVIGVMWLIYYLAEPFLSTYLFGALGIFASSLSRTRTGGLFAAAGFRFAYAALVYVLSQMFSVVVTLVMTPLMLATSAAPSLPRWLETLLNNPAILTFSLLMGLLIWLGLVIAWQVGSAALLLAWSIRRTDRLPYG